MGIDGDDAIEFMEAFSKKFDVDLSAFEFDKYFGSENSAAFRAVWYALFKRKKVSMKQISVENLVTAARIQKWLE